MKTIVLGFGILIASLLVLFKLAEFSYFEPGTGPTVWIAVISLVFFGIGVFISRNYFPPKIKDNPSPVPSREIDPLQVEKLGLSKREYEILQLINDGLSNQQIADSLFITERTARFHVTSIFNKLGADNRAQAVALATQRGLL